MIDTGECYECGSKLQRHNNALDVKYLTLNRGVCTKQKVSL